MKITVITGSPRKNGNTFAMVESFIKESEAKGHEVTRFGWDKDTDGTHSRIVEMGSCR